RAERTRFVRHLRPFWDVHRHRLAPDVAAAIDALRDSGRLDVIAGKILEATPDGDGHIALAWRPRGEERIARTTIRRIVNCTGPQGDVTRSREPIVAKLLARGLIRPDPMRLGIEVDARLRAVGGDGRPHPRLYAIGPMTRGAFWEIVAVPDLREQTWRLARALSNAHWVGGEGL
ncbi:MAG: FAD-dependent oxidoreductase, partial [Sphingomonadaceae bacterium]|nr:FAD-dependent oxidoreductase [Sphingomonadaceae bacterium]